MITSRELVYRTLEFKNNDRVPRQLWYLPWAATHFPDQLEKIKRDFPDDIQGVGGYYDKTPKTYGDPYAIGEYIDEWGCKFTNYQSGIIGEIKEPLVVEDDWEDWRKVNFPRELLYINKEKINGFCRNSDKFIMAGACPRPFERLQFIRGTEQLYIDLMIKPKGMYTFISKMHDYYCELLTTWAKTDVDALSFMDDWGAQNSLLINPKVWVEIFKPMYKNFVDIAHSHGKKIFMHSDGYTLEIIPHLIEIGVDALNTQIFCIGIDKLEVFRGKITFWGEIDRQHLLPNGTTEQIEEAVKLVKERLWDHGGCIAQCEFGIGGNPDNVYKVYETWNKI